MDEYFPSEIARLILGYLKEADCLKSWKTFLEESSNLQEYYLLYKRGKVYTTNVDGKSLLEILKEYRILKKGINADENDSEIKCSEKNSNIPELGFNAKRKGISEEIVKSVVDLALDKCLPLIHRNRDALSSSNSVAEVNSSDSGVNSRDGNGSKSSSGSSNNLCENKEDKNQTDNNELNTELNLASESACHDSLHPNISEVFSLSDFAHNTLDSSKNGTCDNFSKDETVDDLSKNTAFNNSSKGKSLNMLEVMSENGDSNLQVSSFDISIECENKTNEFEINTVSQIMQHTEPATDYVSKEKCASDLNHITASNFLLSDIQENNDVLTESITANDIKLENADTLEIDLTCGVQSNSNSENIHITTASCFQNSVPVLNTQLNDNSNIEVTEISGNSQNVLSQANNLGSYLNSSNNQLGFVLATNSNQLSVINKLSLPSAPTYILSNISPSGFFMQNAAPYSIVMNAPFDGLPLALPSVSVNNISSPVFTTIDSSNINKSTLISPAPSSTVSGGIPLALPGISDTISDPVLSTTNAEKVNENAVARTVSSNSFSDASAGEQSCQSKVISDNKAEKDSKRRKSKRKDASKQEQKNKELSELSSSHKRCYPKRGPKRKLLCLFPSSPEKHKDAPHNKSVLFPSTPGQLGLAAAFNLPLITDHCKEDFTSPVPNSSPSNSSLAQCLNYETTGPKKNNENQNNNRENKSREINIEVQSSDSQNKSWKKNSEVQNHNKRKKAQKQKNVAPKNVKKNKLSENNEVLVSDKSNELREENKHKKCDKNKSHYDCNEMQINCKRNGLNCNSKDCSSEKPVMPRRQSPRLKEKTEAFTSIFESVHTINVQQQEQEKIVDRDMSLHPSSSSELSTGTQNDAVAALVNTATTWIENKNNDAVNMSNSKVLTASTQPAEFSSEQDKQNFQKSFPVNIQDKGITGESSLCDSIPRDCKLGSTPYVKLTKLPIYKIPNLKNELEINVGEKNIDNCINLDNELEQPSGTVSGEKSLEIGTQNSDDHPVLSHSSQLHNHNFVDRCETTQDIVEADIGRSNEEGSELALAIACCEKELLKSQSDHCSHSPDLPPVLPEKETFENHGNSTKSITQAEICARFKSLIEKYGYDYILARLDDSCAS